MTIQQTISQLANQCVLCGICIPHCPTYRIFKTENESPRGRIALFKALAEEQIAASEDLITSLEHCLSCRACEKVCPSQVDYNAINHLGRALISEQYPHHQRPLKQQLAEKLLMTPSLHPLLKLSAKAAVPLQALFGQQATLTAVNESTADSAAVPKGLYPAAGHSAQDNPQLTLFKGCSSDLFEQQTLNDAINLLNACQYDVFIPKQQCCGAINARQGDLSGLQAQARANIAQAERSSANSQALIAISNSCSGQLQEYHKLTGLTVTDQQQARHFSAKVYDIISFLAQDNRAAQLEFAPLIANNEIQEIGVHVPCSLKNVLKEEALLFTLLARIPNIRLIKINDQYCCGAAGSYMLQYPEVARQLLDAKIEDVIPHQYSIIVSSNIGCSLHFQQGLQQHEKKIGRKVAVMHPIHLLARQLIKRD